MSIFKCKMCGGTLEVNDESVAVCEYCGTKQTLPKLNDDRRANLYDRANHFRRNNDFDKAMGIYEQILNEDNTDAEAYWSLVLCRYGIEYVEDPASHKRIPTVNRAQFTSIFDDEDYKSALQYADTLQREVYESEASAINEIQKGILAISQKEEPFDIFICYKETDNNGRRTQDSVLATELYHELTREGFKVFFSRITLEDKLGVAYEPYIFAALNSAKVMVVLGTRPEHFNAVWVKNEWGRYLALIKNGAKKTLIPAYRDMDPYDLPEEFSHLQAQDMSKLGFMQDLVRGITKIAEADAPKVAVQERVKETVVVGGGANIAPLLKRAFMFLEDGDWSSADEYCEKVLDQDPENAQAYLGKLMAELKVKRKENLADCRHPFNDRNNYQKALRFGDEALKTELAGYIEQIVRRNELKRLESTYSRAIEVLNSADTVQKCREAEEAFRSISGYKDADAQAEHCLEKAETVRKDTIYASAVKDSKSDDIGEVRRAIRSFADISGWRDSDERISACRHRIEELEHALELAHQEAQRIAEQERIEAEKKTKRNKIIGAIVLIALVIGIVALNLLAKGNGTADNYDTITSRYVETTIPHSTAASLVTTSPNNVAVPPAQTHTHSYSNFVCDGCGEPQPPSEGLKYTKYDTYCAVSGLGSCTDTIVVIASEYEGLPVTAVKDRAFEKCNQIESVYIPNGITSIGDKAFSNCGALKNIIIPDSVTSIGNGAFETCYALTSIVIPDGVTSISNSLFEYCTSLSNITIPDSVTRIWDDAFSCCSSLTSITIPDSVTIIGMSAFSGCSSLTSITIPDSVTRIWDFAFAGCSALTSVIIPDSITSIGDDAFRSCTALTSIIIPDSVTGIENDAFWGCTALTSVTFPDSVTSIGNAAFGYCSSLKRIAIPDGVTDIGEYAFTNCSALTNVIIPDSVTQMGSDVFNLAYEVTVFCESKSQPDGWASDWRGYSSVDVYWKDEWKYVNGMPVINQ